MAISARLHARMSTQRPGGRSTPRSGRRLRCVLLAAALATSVAAGAPAAAGAATAAGSSGQTIVLGPADAGRLQPVMRALTAGDTLLLAPGRYAMGYITIFAHPGTPDQRITVAAQDPANPPLLQGLLRLNGTSYWTIDSIRVQATVRGLEAISLNGGTDWVVQNSEFFGAGQTGAYTNVTIGNIGDPAGPRHFSFTANCVHDAGRTYPANPRRRQMDHNIYVNFGGTRTSGGSIDHNLIFDHPNGAGIKIGPGGGPASPGPWGIRVTHNTIVEGGRQIVLYADSRYNLIDHNILSTSRAPFTRSPKTTAIYVAGVATTTNAFAGNYVARSDMVAWDNDHRLRNLGGNGLKADPRFTAIGRCNGWRTTLPAAAPFGRWG